MYIIFRWCLITACTSSSADSSVVQSIFIFRQNWYFVPTIVSKKLVHKLVAIAIVPWFMPNFQSISVRHRFVAKQTKLRISLRRSDVAGNPSTYEPWRFCFIVLLQPDRLRYHEKRFLTRRIYAEKGKSKSQPSSNVIVRIQFQGLFSVLALFIKFLTNRLDSGWSDARPFLLLRQAPPQMCWSLADEQIFI